MSILDGVSLFVSLASHERDTLALFCQERIIRAGDVLFHEGEDAMALYVVKSGSLKAYKERSDGEVLLGYINAGDLAGEMALFDPDAPKRRMASVRAVDDSRILVIMDYAILELSKQHREIYGKISQIIVSRKPRRS